MYQRREMQVLHRNSVETGRGGSSATVLLGLGESPYFHERAAGELATVAVVAVVFTARSGRDRYARYHSSKDCRLTSFDVADLHPLGDASWCVSTSGCLDGEVVNVERVATQTLVLFASSHIHDGHIMYSHIESTSLYSTSPLDT